ncbi:DUF4403 family protein [Pseudoroseomonas globiformis]|uniref:DUF4403 family protein n=1 Tax=Teichococcus globiformis TaxID=2307229 RepID=A0ABV7G505_9PROT
MPAVKALLRRRWFGLLLLPVLVVGGGVGASAWLQGRDILLSAEPPRRATRVELPARESVMALRLRLPFDLLQNAAGRVLPAEFRQQGEGSGMRYDLAVRRAEPVVLEEVDGRLRATVDITVNGSAGLSGSLAGLLSLGVKNIDAAARVTADLGLSLDEGWCPAVEMVLDYRWTRKPRLEIIGGVWIGIEEQVRARVEEAMRTLPAQLRSAIPCDQVREAALELWQPQTIVVQLPAAPPLHIGITPEAIGLSELAVRPQDIRVVLALRARTTVSSDPPRPAPPRFLPPLRQVPDRGGRMRLSIPVRAGYDMIRDWLMTELGSRDLPFETPLGLVTLRIRDLFIYPSDPAIAVAVTFSAELPGFWPDTTGRVVFSGRPVLEGGGSRIRLEDLRFARNLDSALWSVVTLALEPQIRAALSDLAVYDLRDIMNEAVSELRRRLADPAFTGGLRVSLSEPTLRLERVAPENDALTVLGALEAGIDAEVTALPF